MFVGCAYPVAEEINQRGHNWCEAYLDDALPIARAALASLGDKPPAQDGLVDALEGLIEQCVACEKELTEVVYQTDYCGESGPLCNARKALSAIKGDKS